MNHVSDINNNNIMSSLVLWTSQSSKYRSFLFSDKFSQDSAEKSFIELSKLLCLLCHKDNLSQCPSRPLYYLVSSLFYLLKNFQVTPQKSLLLNLYASLFELSSPQPMEISGHSIEAYQAIDLTDLLNSYTDNKVINNSKIITKSIQLLNLLSHFDRFSFSLLLNKSKLPFHYFSKDLLLSKSLLHLYLENFEVLNYDYFDLKTLELTIFELNRVPEEVILTFPKYINLLLKYDVALTSLPKFKQIHEVFGIDLLFKCRNILPRNDFFVLMPSFIKFVTSEAIFDIFEQELENPENFSNIQTLKFLTETYSSLAKKTDCSLLSESCFEKIIAHLEADLPESDLLQTLLLFSYQILTQMHDSKLWSKLLATLLNRETLTDEQINIIFLSLFTHQIEKQIYQDIPFELRTRILSIVTPRILCLESSDAIWAAAATLSLLEDDPRLVIAIFTAVPHFIFKNEALVALANSLQSPNVDVAYLTDELFPVIRKNLCLLIRKKVNIQVLRIFAFAFNKFSIEAQEEEILEIEAFLESHSAKTVWNTIYCLEFYFAKNNLDFLEKCRYLLQSSSNLKVIKAFLKSFVTFCPDISNEICNYFVWNYSHLDDDSHRLIVEYIEELRDQ